MQNNPPLIGAPSELEQADSVIGTQAERAARPVLLQLLKALESGSLAGLAFGVADLARASAVGPGLSLSVSVVAVGLWIWFGQLLGVIVWSTRFAAVGIKRRLSNPAAWYALLALTAGGLTLLLSRKVLGGPGISQTFLGHVGRWLAPMCAVFGAWVAPWLATMVPSDCGRSRRWGLSAGAVALAVLVAILESRYSGMLFMRVVLLVAVLALSFQAVELVRLPAWMGHASLALSLVSVPGIWTFPASRAARQLLAQPVWAGSQLIDYIRFHIDFDHDGYSPLFGAGDCNDADASVFVGAPEQAGDGRDSDCDGQDDPKPSVLPLQPFHPTPNPGVQLAIERAQYFPTVVILIDALRDDRIGNPRFPNLARLSRESIRFTRAYSSSSTTLGSVPAIMSGSVRPAPGQDNIAHALARVGRISRLIAPDAIVEHFQKLKDQNPLLSFSAIDSIATDRSVGFGAGATTATSERLTHAAIEQLDLAHPPDLIWLHYYDLHQWDVLQEAGLPSHGDIARYDAVLARMDQSFGPLLARRDRVNIVILADHGESLGTRGLKSHASFMFHEMVHIPLLVRIPGAEACAVDTPVTGPGVFNALRELRGLAPDTSVDMSVLDLVGAANAGAGPGLPGFDSAQWSLVYGNHRLVYTPQAQVAELYDIGRDPREKWDLAEEDPQLTASLLARLFQLHNQAPR